jgi:hypothetical protein
VGILDLFGAKPSPAKFATLMSDAARRQGITDPIRFDPEAFSLSVGGDGSRVFNLHNAFNDYCRAPKGERGQVIAAYAAAFVPPSIPTSFADARAGLLPILRSRALPEVVRLSQLGDADTTPDAQAALPFSADTVLMLAYDSAHAVQTLGAATLKEWGVSAEECLPIALENLRDRSVSTFEQVAPGLYVGAWNDSYDTSRLLFPDLVHQLNLGADPVMMIPTRARLLATSAGNAAGLQAMVDLAQHYADQEGRQISTLMYRFQQGRAVQYLPEAALAARLKPQQLKALVSDYAGQKDLLDKFHERKGIDIYVASCELMRAADGSLVTMSVWTEGVPTLLPKSDLVVLNRFDEVGDPIEMIAVAWDELAGKTDVLVALEASYPPRYRTTGFPSKAVCATLLTIEL